MNDWIEWKWSPEKPYPEKLDSMVYTRRGDDVDFQDKEPARVSWWLGHQDSAESSNWHKDCALWARITHYRLASEEK